MRTEREKMVAGELYRSADPELVALRLRARRLTREFNASSEADPDLRRALLSELFGRVGPRVEIEPDFRCDYGFNIAAGDNLFMNFGCVILDVAPVTLGRNVMLAAGVHLYTATHPLDPVERASGLELAAPIVIGDDVWIGGHATICPGVTVGDAAVIGAGAVVTRDVPPRTIVAGNPAKPIRSIETRA